jgi:1-aminocyclopropane-1-carboxylate deaminase
LYLPISNISIDKLESRLLNEKQIELSILRLDKIHEDVSGNKLFKLHFYIEKCLQSFHKTILTFGGAYSNHLVATAFLCNEKNIKCIGIVRGEQPQILSHTLLRCKMLGMQLYFVSREKYKAENDKEALKYEYGECIIVPEGGYEKDGACGASKIMDCIEKENATHISSCVGTGTTLAGLLMNNKNKAEIIAVPVIKNMQDIDERIKYLTNSNYDYTTWGDYHFGGYAKFDKSLISFMNGFFKDFNVPTDFVYTAKMMYAVFDKINYNYFKKGSKIICIHTGGLQGNKSLKEGLLHF